MLSMPHFCLLSSGLELGKGMAPPPPIEVNLLVLSSVDFRRGDLVVEGMSKICSVDLSDVTASSWLFGEMDMENILAGSIPRRSSAIRAQLLVAKTRTRVP